MSTASALILTGIQHQLYYSAAPVYEPLQLVLAGDWYCFARESLVCMRMVTPLVDAMLVGGSCGAEQRCVEVHH